MTYADFVAANPGKMIRINADGTFTALTPPAPAPMPRLISAAEFRDRFTAAELAATSALAYSSTGDVPAQLLLLKVSTNRDGIDLDSAETVGGLDYLISKGKLTSQRKADILS